MSEEIILKKSADDEELSNFGDQHAEDHRKKYDIATKFPEIEKAEIDFRWVKKYLEEKSFCQEEYLFRRSLVCHFEVEETSFRFFAYNFKLSSPPFLELKNFLIECEYWFSEKIRFWNFVKNVKAQNGKLLKCEKIRY